MIVTISRQAATNGELIGRLVAERLGVPSYDRELVEEMARRLQVDPDVMRVFDEVAVTPIQSIISEWRSSLNEVVYERLLRQALHGLATENRAVIIGRGANFVLRGSQVLNVRLVAPMALRVGIAQVEYDLSETDARRLIRREDADRAHFIRTMFHHDIDDATQYDLMVNLAEFPPESAVELILRAAHINAATGLPAELDAALPQHIALMTRHRRHGRPDMVDERLRKLG
jgi:cytidylate kinase